MFADFVFKQIGVYEYFLDIWHTDLKNINMKQLDIPVIVFSKESSHAYILISFILLRISFIVRTLLSVINKDFHLNVFMSLAKKIYKNQEKYIVSD